MDPVLSVIKSPTGGFEQAPPFVFVTGRLPEEDAVMATDDDSLPPDQVCPDGKTWRDDDGCWRDVREPPEVPSSMVIGDLPGDPPPDLPPDLDAALNTWFRGIKWTIAQVLSVGQQP